MKNSLDWFKNKSEQAEGRACKLKDRLREIIQSEEQKEEEGKERDTDRHRERNT